MDADDILLANDFETEQLGRAWTRIYHLEVRLGPIRLWRAQIFSNRLPFRYKGVLHEFVAGPRSNSSSGTVSGIYIQAGNEVASPAATLTDIVMMPLR